MPQNAARQPATGSRIQGVGIGADGVEGDIAEIEQAGEPDHDVEPPAEHHVDQNLDAEIVDPFHRALNARDREHERRIDDRETERKRNEPAREPRAGGVLGPRPQGATCEPGSDQQRVEKATAGDDCDQRREQWPARLQDELVVDVLDGVEADQREQQAECDETGDRGLAQRANDVDAGGEL